MTNIINKRDTAVVVRFTANDSVVLTGNNTVSNLTATNSEVIEAVTLNQVWYGSGASANTHWTLTVGNSTVNSIVGVYSGTDWVTYAGHAAAIPLGNTGANNYNPTLYATLVGTTNGYIMMELKKVVSIPTA